jgi:hypothetical protein
MSQSKKFNCSICKFSTSSNYNLEIHYGTKKHIANIQSQNTVISTKFECAICNKQYKGNSGLWAHKKICVVNNKEQVPINVQNSNNNQNVLEQMIKSNIEEMAKMNIRMDSLSNELKQNQQSIQTINNTNNNTTINNNNTFNMSIFLNEKCGNAINFEEFIKKIMFEKADSRLMIDSYVEGTCNIIQRNLEELPINKRPLHYMVGEDPHQHLMHIRQDDKWNMSTELNWMQQIHADDDDSVLNKNPIYYGLQEIDQEKLKYLGYFFNQDKTYMLQHGRLHREITRPDFKEKVYQSIMKMITLDVEKLDDVDKKSKIEMLLT